MICDCNVAGRVDMVYIGSEVRMKFAFAIE